VERRALGLQHGGQQAVFTSRRPNKVTMRWPARSVARGLPASLRLGQLEGVDVHAARGRRSLGPSDAATARNSVFIAGGM